MFQKEYVGIEYEDISWPAWSAISKFFGQTQTDMQI